MHQTEELSTPERLSAGNSVVHRLHPAVMSAAAAIFLIMAAFFDRRALGVSSGFLSLCTLLLRAFLCAAAVQILIAATPRPKISLQFRRFHVPGVFMTVLEMCYRYTAYRLRSCGAKGIALTHAGSFAGSLFLRSAGRAGLRRHEVPAR
jgi:energy-coupling factor transporter transmembrane protein EcfT